MGDLTRAARALLAEWETRAEVMDADEQHVVIQVEPQAGTVQAVGPYPDLYTAMADLGRMREEIGEPIEFLVIPYFPAPDR